jgi:hypothetical protein
MIEKNNAEGEVWNGFLKESLRKKKTTQLAIFLNV